MKPLYFIAVIALLAWACSPVKEASKTSATVALSSQDSTEYEIYINDPGFDLWYQLNYSEPKDHSNDYYRSKNLVAVPRWNDYYRQGRSIDAIDSYIDYQPQIDYGIEVNRKLFWYFKYVAEKYKIQLFW
jgi:hypothetical protein